MTIESELYNHLETNFSGPTFAWISENVNTRPQAGTYYITPVVELISSEVLEVPYSSSNVRRDYRLGLNILVPYDQGTSTVRTYIDSLTTLYSKKDIATSSYKYYFEVVESRSGFISTVSSEHFETPVYVDFRVYST